MHMVTSVLKYSKHNVRYPTNLGKTERMTKQVQTQVLSLRQAAILSQVSQHGYVTIDALSAQFNVSDQTVRRDIIELSNQGRIQRFHGGAGPIESLETQRLDYLQKRGQNLTEKATVGRKAADLIHDGAALYLDVGTTIEACAHDLAKRKGFTVFTNSMRAAMAFDPKHHQVFVLGGRMAGVDGSLVGNDVVQKLSEIHLDYALIACSGIDENARVMDFDISKIAVKKAAMAAAKQSFLLATLSKLNRSALAVISHIDDFETVISERD